MTTTTARFIRSRLTWALALVVLVVSGDRLGGAMLGHAVKQSQFRYSRMYRGEAKADILLVGNSRGLVLYEPTIRNLTGLETFNLSYNALTADLAGVLVADYLDTHPSPSLLIVEVTLCDRIVGGLTAGFSPYSPLSNRLESLITDSAPRVAYGGRLSHLFRYNSEVFQRALYHYRRPDTDWLTDRRINGKMLEDLPTVEPYRFEFDDRMLDELGKLTALARDRGIDVRLLVNPYVPGFAARLVNLDDLIHGAEKATGLPVLDYSLAVEDSAAFADFHHVNKAGSVTYVELLARDGVFEVAAPSAPGPTP